MLDKDTSAAYTKMLYGENAIRTRALICFQDNGEHNTFLGTCPNIKTTSDTHEFMDCEIIIRPIHRMSTCDYTGHGIESAAQAGFASLIERIIP